MKIYGFWSHDSNSCYWFLQGSATLSSEKRLLNTHDLCHSGFDYQKNVSTVKLKCQGLGKNILTKMHAISKILLLTKILYHKYECIWQIYGDINQYIVSRSMINLLGKALYAIVSAGKLIINSVRGWTS